MTDETTILRADVAPFDFLWIEDLIDPWLPEYLFQVGQAVRPSLSNGFLAIVTKAGLSGFREPIWPRESGAIVQGELAGVSVGSVEFQMARPEAASIPTIDSSTFTVTPTGIVVPSSQTIQESRLTRIQIDGSAALAGEYTITAEIIDGLGRDHIKRKTFVLED
jgi:hypothetical protein